MFGYKSVLHLFGVSNPIVGLEAILESGGKSEYELADFSYEITQKSDATGKPQGDVWAGLINLSLLCLPTTELLEWMLDSRKYKSGVVTVYDMEDLPLQKIIFSCAACVSLDFEYKEMDDNYCRTHLTLSAKSLQVGEVGLENPWKNV